MARTSKKEKTATARNSIYEPSGLETFSGEGESFDFGAAPEVSAPKDRGLGVKDTVAGLATGAVGLAQDLSGFAGAFVGDDPNTGILDESLKAAKDYTASFKSKEILGKEAELNRLMGDDAYSVGDVLSYLKSNPSVAVQMGVESLPGMAAMAVGAGGLAKLAAVQKFIAGGRALGAVGEVAARGAISGGIEGVQVAGGVYNDTQSQEAAGLAFGLTTLTGITPGNVTSAAMQKGAGAITARGARELEQQFVEGGLTGARGVATRTGGAILGEAGQETVQSIAEARSKQYGQGNVDLAGVFDPEAGNWKGALKEGAVGGVVGGLMGGAAHPVVGHGGMFKTEDQRSAAVDVAQSAGRLAEAQAAFQASDTDATRTALADAYADYSARVLTPSTVSEVADVTASAAARQIVGSTTADEAIRAFEAGAEMSSALRTGHQVASEAQQAAQVAGAAVGAAAAAAINPAAAPAPAATTSTSDLISGTEMQPSYNPDTVEHDTGVAPRVSTAPVTASTASPITPTEPSAVQSPALAQPAAPRFLTQGSTVSSQIESSTPDGADIMRVANHVVNQDPITNIAVQVARMSGDATAGRPIRRPASVPIDVWNEFVADAQRATGVMVPFRLTGETRTVRDHLQDVFRTGSNPGRVIAQTLLASNNPNLGVNVEPFTARDMRERSEARGYVSPNFQGDAEIVRMNPQTGTESAFLHETLHAITLRWLTTVSTTDPLYIELKTLAERVRREADSRVGQDLAAAPYGTHPGDIGERRQLAEFLAEAMNRATFQTFLDSIQVESDRTAWDTFVAWVGRLIGTTNTRSITALDHALRINQDVITESSRLSGGTPEVAATPEPTPAATPEPTPAATPEPTPAATPLQQARAAWMAQQNANDVMANEFEARSDEDLQALSESTRRPNTAEYARQLLAERAAASAPATDGAAGEAADSPAIAAAIDRILEVARRNGGSVFYANRDIADARDNVANNSQEMLEREVASLEAGNEHSLAQLYRALMDEQELERVRNITFTPVTPAPAPAADEGARVREALLQHYRDVGMAHPEDRVTEFENYDDADISLIASNQGVDRAVADFARYVQRSRTMSLPPTAPVATPAPTAVETAQAAAIAAGLNNAAVTGIEAETEGALASGSNDIRSTPEMRAFRFALLESRATHIYMTRAEFEARERELAEVTAEIAIVSQRAADNIGSNLHGYTASQLNNLANGLQPDGNIPLDQHSAMQTRAARVGIAFQLAIPMTQVGNVITPVAGTPLAAATPLTPAQRGAITRARNTFITELGHRVGNELAGSANVFNTLNRGRPVGTASRHTPLQRRYTSLINRLGVDQAREWAINQYYRMLQQRGLAIPQVLTDWIAVRNGTRPTPTPAPRAATPAAPTMVELNEDLASAEGELNAVGPAEIGGVRISPVHISSRNDAELADLLHSAEGRALSRTVAMIRAQMNVRAMVAGRPLPHARWTSYHTSAASPARQRTPQLVGRGQEQTSLPPTAVAVADLAYPPPSLNAEQSFPARLAAAQRSGALAALAEFWNRVTGQPGQRLFAQDEIPVDDLRDLARQNNNELNQSILDTLRQRYNDAFTRHAEQWARDNNRPIPLREEIITRLRGSGTSASISLYGRGRGDGNPFLRQGQLGDSSLGISNTTTEIRHSPGASDICYRVSADMMYITGQSSRNSNGLCTNNNVRRQWQSFAQGARLGNPTLMHPIGTNRGNDYRRVQGMPESFNTLSVLEQLGANALRMAHNAWYARDHGGGNYIPKSRVFSNLVLNPDAETYTALYDPVDTRGFPRGTIVTKAQLRDKVGEVDSHDTSHAGGMGGDTLTFAMLTDQFLEAFANGTSPIALETMAVNYGRDSGGWFMAQDGAAIDPLSQAVFDLFAELRQPGTSKARKAEINGEIRALQDQRARAAEEASNAEALDMENVNRMVGELRVAGEAGAAFAAAGAGRAFSKGDTVPSDAETANSPEGRAEIVTAPVSPPSRNEMEIVGRRGNKFFERLTEWLRMKFQDKDVTLRRVLQTIGDTSTLDAMDRFAGIVQTKLKELVSDPMSRIEGVLNAAKITRQDFEKYLINRHAREYNAQIASIDPLQFDAYGNRLSGFDHELHPGSGIKSSVADAYMAQTHRPEIIEAAGIYDKMTRDLQEFAIETGLEDRPTISTWRAMFPNYVPFRRVLDIEEAGGGTGSGFSVREGISRRALGSQAEIVAPLVSTLEMGARIVERGEKARVAQAMRKTAMTAAIPMFRTRGGQRKPMWIVNSMPNIRTSKRVRVYNITENGAVMRNDSGIPMEFYNGSEASAYARILMQNNPQKVFASSDTGFHERVVSAHNPAYINKPNVVVIPENGKNTVLVFDEDSEDARAMARNFKNLDTAQINAFLAAPNAFSRWVVGTSTGYNPVFAPINFLRDIQSSAININSEKIPGWTAADSLKLMGNAVLNIKPLMDYLKAQHKARHSNGVAPPVPTGTAAMMERAKAAGGLTGVRESFGTYEDALRNVHRLFGESITPSPDPRIRNDLANRSLNAINAASDAFGRFLEGDISERHKIARALSNLPVLFGRLNNAFELATRVAAFEGAVTKFEATGMTPAEADKKAAVVSKNVSVNFNRRGQLTSNVNALYPFFNASMQGSARLAELMFEKQQVKNENGAYEQRTELTSLGKKVAAALPALGVAQALLLAAAGFDDDQPPEWEKSRNFIIPTGGKDYYKLPMPLGLNAIFNIGRSLTEAVLHPANAWKHVVSAVGEVPGAFNPLGNTPNGLLQITPAVGDIPVALMMNRDAFDRPIFKEDRDPRRPTPGWTRNKEGAAGWAVSLAEMLNNATGGNEYRPGVFNYTGDQIEYIAGQLGGGVAREGIKLEQFALGNQTSEDRPWYKVPLLGKFVGSAGDSAAVRDQLYKTSAELNVLSAEYKGLKDDRKFAEANAFLKEHPEVRMHDDFDRYFKAEGKKRKERTALQREGDAEAVAQINADLRTKGEKLMAEVDRIRAR
jgi:hypothetical protein